MQLGISLRTWKNLYKDIKYIWYTFKHNQYSSTRECFRRICINNLSFQPRFQTDRAFSRCETGIFFLKRVPEWINPMTPDSPESCGQRTLIFSEMITYKQHLSTQLQGGDGDSVWLLVLLISTIVTFVLFVFKVRWLFPHHATKWLTSSLYSASCPSLIHPTTAD